MKDCEAAGKEVSIDEWIREPKQLDVKIAYEESFALAAKIATEKEALSTRKKYTVNTRQGNKSQ